MQLPDHIDALVRQRTASLVASLDAIAKVADERATRFKLLTELPPHVLQAAGLQAFLAAIQTVQLPS